ncbi:MAG: hypothetical protein R2856_09705 [Caldilineaceae bacterium]
MTAVPRTKGCSTWRRASSSARAPIRAGATIRPGRGLAWSLYGFGTAYGHTGDARFLQTAQNNAAFYIERTPDHGVPPNDWEEQDPKNPHESSAAAITASGLMNLSRLVGDPTLARYYEEYACRS